MRLVLFLSTNYPKLLLKFPQNMTRPDYCLQTV